MLLNFFSCVCVLSYKTIILHIFPLISPHSYIVGILLHLIKNEAERWRDNDGPKKRSSLFEPRCLLNNIFAAKESRILFWAARLIRAEWPYWEMLSQLEKKICLNAVHLYPWQVSALFWSKGEWQLSPSKSSGQTADLEIWAIGSYSMIIIAF